MEVGKHWFYGELEKLAFVETNHGWETKELRDAFGLKKSGKKAASTFHAHCVDSWVLAYSADGGHLNGTRLLSRKMVESMTINHLWGEYTEGFGFGLGFWVLVDVARSQETGSEGSFGWGSIATTWFLIDPQEEPIAILMTQSVLYGHYPVVKQFKALTYQAIVD